MSWGNCAIRDREQITSDACLDQEVGTRIAPWTTCPVLCKKGDEPQKDSVEEREQTGISAVCDQRQMLPSPFLWHLIFSIPGGGM